MPNNDHDTIISNEGLCFEEQLEALTTTFLNDLRGLCIREGKAFEETLGELQQDIPKLALRTRTYMPNTWNTVLCLAAKEIPEELRLGGRQIKGQLVQWAKANIYGCEERREELEQLVEEEKAELRDRVRKNIDSVKKARKKALKSLEKSVDKICTNTRHLVCGAFIEEEAQDAAASMKQWKPRDELRKEYASMLLKNINEQVEYPNKQLKQLLRRPTKLLEHLEQLKIRIISLEGWGDPLSVEARLQSMESGELRSVMKALEDERLKLEKGE
ncbi:hypothetical protein L211DRAFT_848700 [Terfezia boudieri ATCC MYA-4762]|uniref:Uncharacterized protein n=1 Tax=Terfezia boudieri ATCC MYA-4762 TaxID=1051890 RepID=A0A3N4LPR1_9PEZI|nr:hypothetical protein L211DRAFT_848700 [Terfezia boudieri ATCC MYA-4762]